MAFIRWKKNKFGLRQAYLIHSYRDEQGRPKHKTLAYLGRDGRISPELLSLLKDRHKDLKVKWDGIKEVAHPAPITDVGQISDADLLVRLRDLRLERGISMKEMVQRLIAMGLPKIEWRNGILNIRIYGSLEQGWEKARQEPHYTNPGKLLSSYLRKAFDA